MWTHRIFGALLPANFPCPTRDGLAPPSLRSFYDKEAPIYTMSRFLPPSKVLDAEITNSILGDGCVVRSGCKINHSVIGLRTLIGQNSTIDDALIMGCAQRPNPLTETSKVASAARSSALNPHWHRQH